MEADNLTRQEELDLVLGSLFNELQKPSWVALVDSNGFIIACFPANPIVEQERISGMTVAAVATAERLLEEFDGEKFRYMSIVGAARQCLIVMLGKERLLSIGLPPGIQPQTSFGPIRSRIPELLKILGHQFKF